MNTPQDQTDPTFSPLAKLAQNLLSRCAVNQGLWNRHRLLAVANALFYPDIDKLASTPTINIQARLENHMFSLNPSPHFWSPPDTGPLFQEPAFISWVRDLASLELRLDTQGMSPQNLLSPSLLAPSGHSPTLPPCDPALIPLASDQFIPCPPNLTPPTLDTLSHHSILSQPPSSTPPNPSLPTTQPPPSSPASNLFPIVDPTATSQTASHFLSRSSFPPPPQVDRHSAPLAHPLNPSHPHPQSPFSQPPADQSVSSSNQLPFPPLASNSVPIADPIATSQPDPRFDTRFSFSAHSPANQHLAPHSHASISSHPPAQTPLSVPPISTRADFTQPVFHVPVRPVSMFNPTTPQTTVPLYGTLNMASINPGPDPHIPIASLSILWLVEVEVAHRIRHAPVVDWDTQLSPLDPIMQLLFAAQDNRMSLYVRRSDYPEFIGLPIIRDIIDRFAAYATSSPHLHPDHTRLDWNSLPPPWSLWSVSAFLSFFSALFYPGPNEEDISPFFTTCWSNARVLRKAPSQDQPALIPNFNTSWWLSLSNPAFNRDTPNPSAEAFLSECMQFFDVRFNVGISWRQPWPLSIAHASRRQLSIRGPFPLHTLIQIMISISRFFTWRLLPDASSFMIPLHLTLIDPSSTGSLGVLNGLPLSALLARSQSSTSIDPRLNHDWLSLPGRIDAVVANWAPVLSLPTPLRRSYDVSLDSDTSPPPPPKRQRSEPVPTFQINNPFHYSGSFHIPEPAPPPPPPYPYADPIPTPPSPPNLLPQLLPSPFSIITDWISPDNLHQNAWKSIFQLVAGCSHSSATTGSLTDPTAQRSWTRVTLKKYPPPVFPTTHRISLDEALDWITSNIAPLPSPSPTTPATTHTPLRSPRRPNDHNNDPDLAHRVDLLPTVSAQLEIAEKAATGDPSVSPQDTAKASSFVTELSKTMTDATSDPIAMNKRLHALTTEFQTPKVGNAFLVALRTQMNSTARAYFPTVAASLGTWQARLKETIFHHVSKFNLHGMRDAWSLRIHNSHTKLVQEVASMKFGSTPIADWLPATHPIHVAPSAQPQGWGGIVLFEDLRSAIVSHRNVYCAFNSVRQSPDDYNEVLDELELIRNTFAVSIESRYVIDELLLGFVQELWIVACTQESLTAAGVIPPSPGHPLREARDVTYKNGHSFNENLKNLKLASPSSFEEKRRAMADRLRLCSAQPSNAKNTPTNSAPAPSPATTHAPTTHAPPGLAHTSPLPTFSIPHTDTQAALPFISVITDDVVDWFDAYQHRWGARQLCIQDILLQHGCPLGAGCPKAPIHFGKGRSREMRRLVAEYFRAKAERDRQANNNVDLPWAITPSAPPHVSFSPSGSRLTIKGKDGF